MSLVLCVVCCSWQRHLVTCDWSVPVAGRLYHVSVNWCLLRCTWCSVAVQGLAGASQRRLYDERFCIASGTCDCTLSFEIRLSSGGSDYLVYVLRLWSLKAKSQQAWIWTWYVKWLCGFRCSRGSFWRGTEWIRLAPELFWVECHALKMHDLLYAELVMCTVFICWL